MVVGLYCQEALNIFSKNFFLLVHIIFMNLSDIFILIIDLAYIVLS